MVDFVNVTVVAAVAGFLLYELGWLSNAVTLSVWPPPAARMSAVRPLASTAFT